jgi:hypothetical protein
METGPRRPPLPQCPPGQPLIVTPPPGLGDGISDQPPPAPLGLDEAVETGTIVTVVPGANS